MSAERGKSGADGRDIMDVFRSDAAMRAFGVQRIGTDGPAARAPGRIRHRTIERRQDHGGRAPCAFCHGYGDVVNPGNGDPAIKVTDWLAPVGCPRCGQTGKEPNP